MSMYEKDNQNDRPEPWEQSFYQTGRTRPPKSYGGLIAVLLVTVIFIGGIASALSLLNIRPFQQSAEPEDHNDSDLLFSQLTEPDTSLPSETTLPNTTYSDISLQINQSPTSVDNIPQAGGLPLQEVYSKAIDSVVSITCRTDSGTSGGTGVILSADGYIVTNQHVIEDAESIQVLLSNDQTLSATLVGADPVSDLAVLHIQGTDLSPAEFGDSGALRVGDVVVAIGDPLGAELRGTMTDGIVSAINRDVETNGRVMTLIQTNAALNAGNSGGPLLNCYGQVIGINTMKIGDYMNDAGVEGLGFAIPSTTVKEVVDQLIRQGYVSGRPCTGFTGEALSSLDQMIYHLPQGIYITEVSAGSDAEAKGISPGDILLRLNDTAVTDLDTLNAVLYQHKAGDTVKAIIYRGGRQYSINLVLCEDKG